MTNGFLTPRWIFTTLLVLSAVGVMARLGFWQLERLEERRVFNAQVEAQVNAPALDLNNAASRYGLTGMEYRPVVVRGEYDAQNEVILRNQVYENVPGYHLLTPLKIAGSEQVILVNRGFIPMDQGQPAERSRYIQNGTVTVRGVLRLPHIPKYFGVPDPTLAPGQVRLDAWNAVNITRMQQQVPYSILPVYIEAAPESLQPGSPAANIPIATASLPDLSEGSHMGYAIQWFSFAATLALGYPYFVKKQLSGARPPAAKGKARHKVEPKACVARQPR